MPQVPKDCVAALVAQMSAAAAAVSSAVLPPGMIPSPSTASAMMQQAMWLSRAHQLIEEQQKQDRQVHRETSLAKESFGLTSAAQVSGALNIITMFVNCV